MDIEAWLRGLGLERHAELFRANDLGLDVLPDLTDADLAVLGLSLGDRKRLLRAIAALRRALGEPSSPALPDTQSFRAGTTAGRAAAAHGDVRRPGGLDRARAGSIRRTCARSCAPIRTRCAGEIARFEGMSPSSWATVCWPISAGRGRMRTRPSGRCGRGWHSPRPSASCRSPTRGAPRTDRHRHRARGRWRPGRRGRGAGAGGGRRDAEPRGTASGARGAGWRGDRRSDAPAARSLLRVRGSGRARAQGYRWVGAGLCGHRRAHAESDSRWPDALPMVGRDQELALLLERWARPRRANARACSWSAKPASRGSAGPCSTPWPRRRTSHPLPVLALPHRQRALAGDPAAELCGGAGCGRSARGEAGQAGGPARPGGDTAARP